MSSPYLSLDTTAGVLGDKTMNIPHNDIHICVVKNHALVEMYGFCASLNQSIKFFKLTNENFLNSLLLFGMYINLLFIALSSKIP